MTAVGGYGRDTLAPGSDIDLLFLFLPRPARRDAQGGRIHALHALGHGLQGRSRHPHGGGMHRAFQVRHDDPHRHPGDALHLRHCSGWKPSSRPASTRRSSPAPGPEFIAAKLAERDERHRKAGDTRYLVEPNVKEGKGGLRDLHTLFWIAKYYLSRARPRRNWSSSACCPSTNTACFEKAEDFLWAVRCHMHFLTGKAEERLSFDYPARDRRSASAITPAPAFRPSSAS